MAKRKKEEKANFEEEWFKRIREAPTRDEKIILIKEFQPLWYASVSHLKPGTIATYGGRLDSRIQKENPGLVLKKADGKTNDYAVLPWKGLTEATVRNKIINTRNGDSKRIREHKIDKPIVISNYYDFMDCWVEMLRDGLEKEVYPLVSFALNFMLPLRANDLVMLERENHDKPSSQTHFFVDEHIENDERVVVGTFCNILPSKQCSDKVKTPGYCTVVLTKKEHYPLVKKGVAFLLDEQNFNRPPTRKLKDILTNPSGCTIVKKENESNTNLWSGFYGHICSHYNVGKCVDSWGWLSDKKYFSPADGRSFCASALSCHLFETERFFSEITSIGKALGHLDTSVQNTYCKFKIHIPYKMPGVVLGKPCQPVNSLTRGIALYERIACHEYNKTKIPGKIPGMTIYDTEDTDDSDDEIFM